ncbi:unnamed protein product [Brassica oleracea var. botrytis]
MGGKVDTSINKGRGPPVFRLLGQNYHRIGSLLPLDDSRPKFQQLYIFDTVNENANRIAAFRDDIVEEIKIMLNESNPYAKILRTAKERFRDSLESMNVKVRLISGRSTDPNTYNMPTCSEVAALLVGDIDEEFEERDIVVETKSRDLARISELHPAYLPLQYPILFPYGEDGYHIDLHLKRTTTTSTNPRFRVSMKEFFSYKLMERGNHFNMLLELDISSSIKKLCVQTTTTIFQILLLLEIKIHPCAEERLSCLQLLWEVQDTCMKNLFITFTCNPKWPEITRYRGSKLPTTDDIDKFICAEIPDQASNPALYDIVRDIMVHGPCGLANPNSPCMVKGKCTKRFPKDFSPHTSINKEGFPVYRRRDDGKSMKKNGIEIDNRYIIPYNPQLLLKYQAHINVEWCNQSRAIKYLFKYINKGNDRVTAKLLQVSANGGNSENTSQNIVDEIKRFIDCRYISPCEGMWRILGFELHYSSTSIQRLSFHIPGEHNVTYDDEEDIDDVLTKEKNQTSQFLEFMKMCSQNSDAKELTYIQFPYFFVWNKSKPEWTPRQRSSAVGRIHPTSPSAGQRFYLRILLNKVKGPTCYEDIRTVDGITYPTHKEACYALGLLDDDKEYIEAIKEASQWGSGVYLRRIFVYLLASESLSQTEHVWSETWHLLSDDILHMQRAILQRPGLEMSNDQLKNQTLLEIEKQLRSSGNTLENFSSMPFPTNINIPSMVNRLITDELCYDRDVCAQEHQRLQSRLTSEQRDIYNIIMKAVTTNSGGVFFVNGFGGTGKT